MVLKLVLFLVLAVNRLTLVSTGTTTPTKKTAVKNNSGVTPAGLCGTWVKESQGGLFTSPNYPEKYPPERECIYIIEASPRQCIDLFFDESFSIEPSWECKFDHIEIRDGPFGFSPIIGRYCGKESPSYAKSSGRYLYIKFVADSELEATGFSVRYNFTEDPEFKDLGDLPPLPFCEFDMGGPEGYAESAMISKEGKALQTEAVDCRWIIRAPPRSKIYLRFLEYEMHNSNECKRNFVAVYDGSSSVEHLKNKFCSTVANDVMLVSSMGVIRMWADQGSRKSRFRILFTTFQEPPCDGGTFFCHSNMCINNTLVCNGIQNCVYPWDENNCKEKRKASILDNLDHTNVAIIAVTCGLVLILLIISGIIQVKQPRKKYIIRRDGFDPSMFQQAFEPPHYELCTLRRAPSQSDVTDQTPDDIDKFNKIRRSSSKCIREHHCGSQTSSVRGSRSDLSVRETGSLAEAVAAQSPHSHHATPTSRRSIRVLKHSYSQDGGDPDEDLMEDGPTTSHMLHHHHSLAGHEHQYPHRGLHRVTSNDF
ncbi:neuropilin and tolloid-like protein 1 [Osmerus mordax]|uniref:neuropilin and tolloid-like protein 1 n=1 Tax=Osmerus mordax TaxID=8014 RepID=UPI00350F0CDB